MDLNGRTMVIRVDEATLGAEGATFFSDLVFLGNLGMRPVVVAPTKDAARAVVRTMNRSGDAAVGLTGADAGMIPAASAETIGNVDPKLLRTLLDAGYVPVIEPMAFGFAGNDVAVAADDVAQALASAVGAARAIFFHYQGGVIDAKTRTLVERAHARRSAHDRRGQHAGDRSAHRGARGGAGRARRRRRRADLRRARRSRGDRGVLDLAAPRDASRGYRVHRMNLRALAASAALLFAAPPLLGATSSIPGLRATGTLVVQANVQGSPVNVGGNVALYHKGSLYRLDVLSLGFPGTSGDLSALAATLIGPGGISALYDGATGALTAWSNGNRTYYTETPARPRGAAPSAAAAAASAPAASGDPLAALARPRDGAARRAERDDPARGAQHRERPSRDEPRPAAQAPAPGQAAGELPRAARARRRSQRVPRADHDADRARRRPNAFGGTAKLDLTSVQADNPDDGLFVVPQGYTRVDSIAGVLRRGG